MDLIGCTAAAGQPVCRVQSAGMVYFAAFILESERSFLMIFTAGSSSPWYDQAYPAYRTERIEHWNRVAQKLAHWTGAGKFYQKRLAQIYGHLIPPGKRVLEVGCGQGDLLAALKPALGVGVDFSGDMIRLARSRHPGLTWIEADFYDPELQISGPFDFILFSDSLNDLWDVQSAFQRALTVAHPGTRLVVNSYSRLWELPLGLARRIGLAAPVLLQNWLTPDDMRSLCSLSGFEPIRSWREVLLPLPLLDGFFNRFLVKFAPFSSLALANFVMARPIPQPPAQPPLVSVIVPARNEAGNIRNILERTPEMGAGTELVFVEGNSTDDTYATLQRLLPEYAHRRTQLLKQDGKGKGDAVRKGYAHASGDVLMILDADLTVPPEDLPRFYHALVEGKGDFINGVRLVYPMEKEAMRALNFLGNKFFSLVFSWLLGQPVKDTLCGTKVLWKKDYEEIAANRAYFGDFDPFGDFDLLFGAARLGFKIVDLPIRYRERTYGSTNIDRWRHGWLLLKMVAFAAQRIKFR